MRHGRGDIDEGHLRFTRKQRLQRGIAALVGHMSHLDTGHRHQEFRGEVAGRADTGGREVDLAGPGLGQGDELGIGLGREARMYRQDLRIEAGKGHRREGLHVVVGQILVEMAGDRESAVGCEQERIAIGRGTGSHGMADGAGGAGLVLDHPGLPHLLRQLDREDAAELIGGSSGRPGNDQLDRPVGVFLRARPKRQHRRDRRGHQYTSLHRALPRASRPSIPQCKGPASTSGLFIYLPAHSPATTVPASERRPRAYRPRRPD